MPVELVELLQHPEDAQVSLKPDNAPGPLSKKPRALLSYEQQRSFDRADETLQPIQCLCTL